MTTEVIYQRVVSLIKDQVGINVEVIPDSSIQEDFFSDSVELMEFIISVEDEFDVTINDDEVDQFSHLSDLVQYLAKKRGN